MIYEILERIGPTINLKSLL